MIKNVIFDLGGVIKEIKNCSINSMLPLGLRFKFGKRYKGMGLRDYYFKYLTKGRATGYEKGLVSKERFAESVAEETGEPLEIVSLINEKINHKSKIVFIKDSLKLIKQLHDTGFNIYVLSNMNKDTVDAVAKLLNKDWFKDMMFSCDVGFVKPDEEIYLAALKKWKIKAEESLLIDDREKNLIPFTRMGGHSIFFDQNNVQDTTEQIYNYIIKFNRANQG